MRIENYSFGKIIINGQEYTSDVIIYPQRVDSSWWRKEGHLLHKDDLQEVLDENPRLLIIGTGKNGMMKVPGELKQELEDAGINVKVARTNKAVTIYNNLETTTDTVAALHLTC
ncbi:MAG: Mth938-like domain-containing protein [bacterium]